MSRYFHIVVTERFRERQNAELRAERRAHIVGLTALANAFIVASRTDDALLGDCFGRTYTGGQGYCVCDKDPWMPDGEWPSLRFKSPADGTLLTNEEAQHLERICGQLDRLFLEREDRLREKACQLESMRVKLASLRAECAERGIDFVEVLR